jgi:hypothetical protein
VPLLASTETCPGVAHAQIIAAPVDGVAQASEAADRPQAEGTAATSPTVPLAAAAASRA